MSLDVFEAVVVMSCPRIPVSLPHDRGYGRRHCELLQRAGVRAWCGNSLWSCDAYIYADIGGKLHEWEDCGIVVLYIWSLLQRCNTASTILRVRQWRVEAEVMLYLMSCCQCFHLCFQFRNSDSLQSRRGWKAVSSSSPTAFTRSCRGRT